MPELKICGVTSASFALEAVRRGASYIGFIFAERSPRRIGVAAAHEIASRTKGARFVGVFVDASLDEIETTARSVPLDVVQLHGKYGADEVLAIKSLGCEVWRLHDGDFAGEDATLLDGRDGGRSGGTGRLADWSLVAELKREGRRVVLAGGISAANIASAAATGADIIDVNSTLETAPGVKSVAKLDELIKSFKTNN